ncbi:AI-2E family transporter [Butyrivibrio sp. NC2002]|uniref:AI-2E family transporter n=1 Tax=Butyrivibrio sp. NC2002 TaxID=1410610 RepID=UPI00055AC3D8|nr:AI-2E family transporter [Butyrivibrio sp. NC2002]
MKFNKDWLNKNWFPYTVAACAGVVLYLLLSNIGPIFKSLGTFIKYFSPVISGLIIAYILSPLVNIYETKVLKGTRRAEVKRSLAVLLSIATVILFIVILMIALIPQIIESITTFVSNLDGYAASLESILTALSIKAEGMHLDISGITAKINEFLSQFAQKLPAVMERLVKMSAGVGNGFLNVILGLILAVYFLSGQARIKHGFERLMKVLISPDKFESMSTFLDKCNNIIIQYIAFDILDGVIVGIVNWIFMIITGMSYSVLISLVVGVTNLAPTFGPILGAIIGTFILVLVNPFHALLFLIFTIILQTIDGYIIKPKLFGESLNVPSVWILVTLVVGGRMFGVAGIMLSIPFAAIFNFVYTDWLVKREKKAIEQDP